MLHPQVLLLKEGTDTSQGEAQLIANINACQAVADILRTTLGPMGLDKLIKTNDTATISNDGATIVKLLDVVHPAAKTLADIAQAQDEESGDGTTSVILFASELMQNAKEFIQEGVAPYSIINGYRKACDYALKELTSISLNVDSQDKNFLKQFRTCSKQKSPQKFLLEECAKTALTSKLIENDKNFFAEMLVNAFLRAKTAGKDFLTVKSVSGGSVKSSFIVDGVVFKKTFSYAGFEQQPKSFQTPKIALLNVELELKTEHLSGEIRVNPEDYKAVVNAEWKILYDKLDLITAAKADVVLSKLPIGDLATQYFAEKGVFCAGRVPEADLRRVAELSGGTIQTSLRALERPSALGTCEKFEEKQVGEERMNFFFGSKSGRKLATLILRGGADQYIEEASRSLNDAIMVIKNTMAAPSIVAGAGATEMELSRRVKTFSNTLEGADSFYVASFAKALEVIPRCLAVNAGMDATDVLNELRCKHHKDNGKHFGVNVSDSEESVIDAFKTFIWEPFASKKNILQSATEAACLVLSVDETVRAPTSQSAPPGGPGAMQMPQMQMPQ